MHTKKIITSGTPLKQASRALILVHGRGGSAEDILTLAPLLAVGDFALLAPQATGNTWYPHSFLMPQEDNEPWLSSAIDILAATVQDVLDAGIPHSGIYLTGFSQGACLTLEFAARHAVRYGGIAAFTGGSSVIMCIVPIIQAILRRRRYSSAAAILICMCRLSAYMKRNLCIKI